MNKGTVKWFNNQKGYGFISDVEFDITEGAKGPQAVNVTVLN